MSDATRGFLGKRRGHRPDLPPGQRLPVSTVVTDIHCVASRSKRQTRWRRVSRFDQLKDVRTADQYLMAHSYGGYSTNHRLDDLRGGQAWIAFEYNGYHLRGDPWGEERYARWS